MNAPAAELAEIRSTYVPSIGRNNALAAFSLASMSLLNENDSPTTVSQPSLLISSSAAIMTCDASASFGAHMVNGTANLSGKTAAWATSATGLPMLSSLPNIGEPSMPCSLSCPRYFATCRLNSMCCEGRAGPMTTKAPEEKPATHASLTTVKLKSLYSDTF